MNRKFWHYYFFQFCNQVIELFWEFAMGALTKVRDTISKNRDTITPIFKKVRSGFFATNFRPTFFYEGGLMGVAR